MTKLRTINLVPNPKPARRRKTKKAKKRKPRKVRHRATPHGFLVQALVNGHLRYITSAGTWAGIARARRFSTLKLARDMIHQIAADHRAGRHAGVEWVQPVPA